MDKLTLVIDCEYNIKNDELNKYLESLNGIDKVIIGYDEEVFAPIFTITYDKNTVSPKLILLEIEAYLNLYKYPCLISFDKHFDKEMVKYDIESRVCCEFCLKIAIEDLFEVDGIVKADSNYIEYINESKDENTKNKITIYCDPTVIDSNIMEKVIKDLNL